MATSSYLWFGQDFRGYYAAARVLLAGGNPYDYNQLAPVLLAVTGRIGNNPYYYPPWFAWLFTPLSILPYEIARVIWMIFNLAIWIFSLYQLGKLLNWPGRGWRRWLMFLLMTYLFAWLTWRYEQMGIVLFALTVAILISLREQKWFWAGICLALFLLKPNVTLVPLIAIAAWLIRRRQWRPVLIMSAALLILFIFSTLATPDWYKPFLQPGFGSGLTTVLDGPNRIVATRINSTLIDFLAWLHIAPTLRVIIYAFAILVGVSILIIVIRRSNSLLEIVAISLLVGFSITPYDLQYDFPPLAFTLMWALAISVRATNKTPKWSAILITIFISSLPLWERPISEAYFLVLGLIGLVILCRRVSRQFILPGELV